MENFNYSDYQNYLFALETMEIESEVTLEEYVQAQLEAEYRSLYFEEE